MYPNTSKRVLAGEWCKFLSLRPSTLALRAFCFSLVLQKYVPPSFVFKDLQKDKLDKLIQRQTALIGKWRKEHAEESAKDPDAYKRAPELRAFCILDDVVSLLDVKRVVLDCSQSRVRHW